EEEATRDVEPVAPDTPEFLRFLQFWMDVTGMPHITLVGIVPDGSTDTATFQRASLDSAERWIEARQSQGTNLYFQPNETLPGCVRKPRKVDIVAAHCRFADIDPADDQYSLAEERHRLLRLADYLAADEDFAPTAIIDSGNGLQPIWAIAREPLSPDST